MKHGKIYKRRCGCSSFSVLVSIPLRLTPTRGLTAFSDLSQTKKRPALVIAELDGDDLMLCAITSQIRANRYTVSLENSDFESGSLKQNSYIRVNRLFTAENKIILYKAGHLKSNKFSGVINKLIEILRS